MVIPNRLYEQQGYVVETNHLPHLISLIVNDEFFQELSPEEQAIMTEAAEIATKKARISSDERISDRVATIEESGTQIVPLSDELRDEIRRAAEPVYKQIEAAVNENIYEAYLAKP